MDFTSLHDFFGGLDNDGERRPADHALVVAIQSIENPEWLNPVLFCLQDGTLDGAFIHSTVLATLSKVQAAGFEVRHILADGASCNLKAFKLLLGLGTGALGSQPFDFATSFDNPDMPGRRISVSVCADHSLKRGVRAAYQSHPDRVRELTIPVALGGRGSGAFSWKPLVKVYYDDVAAGGHRRTPLRLGDVRRDGFADLRVSRRCLL